MSILEWASHFKNIRCILLVDPQKPPSQEVINWVIKKHRWRQVGIGKSLSDTHSLFKSHPFVILPYPDKSIYKTVKTLAKNQNQPFWMMESVALALCYSAPLLCFEEEIFINLGSSLTWILQTDDIPESEIIRHLRIAGYVPIDFFPQIKEHFLILKKGVKKELEKTIKKRKEEAQNDGKKRFWRIKGKEEGKPFVGYIDLMPALVSAREKIISVPQSEFIGLLLSITTIIYFCFPSIKKP